MSKIGKILLTVVSIFAAAAECKNPPPKADSKAKKPAENPKPTARSDTTSDNPFTYIDSEYVAADCKLDSAEAEINSVQKRMAIDDKIEAFEYKYEYPLSLQKKEELQIQKKYDYSQLKNAEHKEEVAHHQKDEASAIISNLSDGSYRKKLDGYPKGFWVAKFPDVGEPYYDFEQLPPDVQNEKTGTKPKRVKIRNSEDGHSSNR